MAKWRSSQKKNEPDITVIRASDSLKWVLCTQNFEHDVTVFSHWEASMCVLLLSVYCFQYAILYNTKFLIQLLHWIKTETANSYINPQIIPQLSNILDANACDVMLKIPLKNTFEKAHNYYNDNKLSRTSGLETFCSKPSMNICTLWVNQHKGES